MFLQLAFCTSFQTGEGRSGRVRSGWGQIRFFLPFAVFLTCIMWGLSGNYPPGARHSVSTCQLPRAAVNACNSICVQHLILSLILSAKSWQIRILER